MDGYVQSELVKLDILIKKKKWMHYPLLYMRILLMSAAENVRETEEDNSKTVV